MLRVLLGHFWPHYLKTIESEFLKEAFEKHFRAIGCNIQEFTRNLESNNGNHIFLEDGQYWIQKHKT